MQQPGDILRCSICQHVLKVNEYVVRNGKKYCEECRFLGDSHIGIAMEDITYEARLDNIKSAATLSAKTEYSLEVLMRKEQAQEDSMLRGHEVYVVKVVTTTMVLETFKG